MTPTMTAMGCGEGDQIHQQYTSILNLLQCEPIAVPVEGQCELVFGTCPTPTSDSFLSAPYDVQYVQSYFCASSTSRPFVFLGLQP
ncbi:hypothetical protein DFH94DRAFT_746110 [Russula ochroleuca]|uniref:Uncharacterized protein n=1 Tax=Russula ochroleuca TaxID=152965 RepID=A0A9P5MU49_9AGAM|nr:hypothetical protein DFH94DRAFT_746110 [Russula ochroleuca]